VGGTFYFAAVKRVLQIGGGDFMRFTEFDGQAGLLLVAVEFSNDIAQVF
jgi:hypothetical protein